MAKTKFLKKAGAKEIGTAAMSAGLRGAGAVGTAFLSQSKLGKKIPTKWHGPLFATLGILGEAFLDDNNPLQKFAQGVSTYGALKTSTLILTPEQVGLSGPGAEEPYYDASPDWAKLAAELQGILDDEDPAFAGASAADRKMLDTEHDMTEEELALFRRIEQGA
jgi:hypothetical protein